jgi:hypothetical protein
MSTQNDLTELESALVRLNPTATRLDARAIAFAAGQRRTAHRTRQYRIACAALAVVLGVSLTIRPKPQIQPVEKIVFVPAPAPANNPDQTALAINPRQSIQEYLQIRQQVLDQNQALAQPAESTSQLAKLTENFNIDAALFGESHAHPARTTAGFKNPLSAGFSLDDSLQWCWSLWGRAAAAAADAYRASVARAAAPAQVSPPSAAFGPNAR